MDKLGLCKPHPRAICNRFISSRAGGLVEFGFGVWECWVGDSRYVVFLEGFVPVLRIVPRQQDWWGGRYLRWRVSLN